MVPLKTEACSIKYIYLGIDDDTIDENKTNPHYFCIGDQLEMGIYPDIDRKIINNSILYFSVNQCINSSANNNSCASKEQIKSMLKSIQVLSSIPKTIYDFQSQIPNSNVYDYHLTFLDPFLTKNYMNGIIPSFLMKDDSLISENYVLDKTNFNPDITYDPQVREETDRLLFRMGIGISFNEKIFRQKAILNLMTLLAIWEAI